MTHEKDDGAADIAWMRKLAEEGAEAPMRGGSILMAAGLIYGLGSVIHWAAISDRIGLGDPQLGLIWLAATGLFLVTLTIVNLRLRGQAGVRTSANRATGAAWMSVGLGIFALFTSIAVIGLRMGEDTLLLLTLTPSIIMVFYGMGWAVSASMTRSHALWWLAIGSFIAAPLLAALSGQDIQYLAYAGCLIVLMAVPGFLLMRATRQA